jgi:hypothetical protein
LVCFVPKGDIGALFDYLIGAGQQRRRHSNAESCRPLHIDDQLKFGWPSNGQLAGPRAPPLREV